VNRKTILGKKREKNNTGKEKEIKKRIILGKMKEL